MGSAGCKRAVRWGEEEEALLGEIEREARGKRVAVVRLAAARLPGRSESAVISKRQEMGFSGKYLVRDRLRDEGRAQLAQRPRLIRLEEAPRWCPDCGGRWRLERDMQAGKMLVCWGCCRTEYVY